MNKPGRGPAGEGNRLNDLALTYLRKEALPCFDSPGYLETKATVWKLLADTYQQREQVAGYIGLALDAYQRSMDTYFSFGSLGDITTTSRMWRMAENDACLYQLVYELICYFLHGNIF
jgi:hypothetical protein